MSNKNLIIAILVVIVAAGAIWYFYFNANGVSNQQDQTALANPASVYCQDHGGQSKIITANDGSQSGVCIFSNGNQCDEWAFYRGECSPNQQNNTVPQPVQ